MRSMKLMAQALLLISCAPNGGGNDGSTVVLSCPEGGVNAFACAIQPLIIKYQCAQGGCHDSKECPTTPMARHSETGSMSWLPSARARAM
jgi:hypothetical protein